MEKRYIKNQNMLSPEENLSLREKKVAVVGCGGLGGNIIEQLARLGIGQITAIDGDVFDETNLNRQLFSQPENLGKKKALEAEKRILTINPDIQITAIDAFLTQENALEILQGHDLIMDALDSVGARRLLSQAAGKLNIPMVYGAIAGWYAQVAIVFPGDNLLEIIYHTSENKGIEQHLGNPSFTPALAASLQVAEAVKYLCKKGQLLRNKLLVANLLENEYQILDF